MKNDILYISDTHLGAGSENLALIKGAFGRLPDFLEANRIEVDKVFDLGDTTENWLPGKGHEKPYENKAVIETMRGVYEKIFADRPIQVYATAGNHQTEILKNPDPDTAMKASDEAVKEFEDFLSKVFRGRANVSFEVFRGIKEADEGILVHHGDFLNRPAEAELLETLRLIDREGSMQDKIDLINSNEVIYRDMQRMWKTFQTYLWPLLKVVRSKKTRDFLFEPAFKIQEKEGIAMYNETLSNYALLHMLADNPEGSAIVSGHLHQPSLLGEKDEGFDGTVAHLGAWHDTPFNPSIGISTEQDGKKWFWLVEFDPTKNEWKIKDKKVIRNVIANEKNVSLLAA